MTPQPPARAPGLSRLRDQVGAAADRYAAWADQLGRSRTLDAGVVIDEAEELRRQLRTAATSAHDLAGRSRVTASTASTASAPGRSNLRVGTVAADLDAAARALRRVSTGLRGDDDLARVVHASARATGRFLRSAAQALDRTDGRGRQQDTGAVQARTGFGTPTVGHARADIEHHGRGRTQMSKEAARHRRHRIEERRAARAAAARSATRLRQAQERQDHDVLTEEPGQDLAPEAGREVGR